MQINPVVWAEPQTIFSFWVLSSTLSFSVRWIYHCKTNRSFKRSIQSVIKSGIQRDFRWSTVIASNILFQLEKVAVIVRFRCGLFWIKFASGFMRIRAVLAPSDIRSLTLSRRTNLWQLISHFRSQAFSVLPSRGFLQVETQPSKIGCYWSKTSGFNCQNIADNEGPKNPICTRRARV